MASTIPRLLPASVTSRGVPCLMGRSASAGGAHATATIGTRWSAGKGAGAPGRSVAVTASCSNAGSAWSLSASTAASAWVSCGAQASQRWCQERTVPRWRGLWRGMWQWLSPASLANRIVARRTRRGGCVGRRASCSKQTRGLGVRWTVGATGVVCATAVVLVVALYKSLMLLGSSDTRSLSV
jgi:hypothetical protein